MKKVFLISVCFSFFCQAFSQQVISVSGIILDSKTKLPLEYASISILGKPVGTISNSVGDFIFHFSNTYLNDTLIISTLGYKPYKKMVADYLKNPTDNFRLVPSEYKLAEFIVTSLTADEIVRKAIKNISKNYPKKTYLLKGFYRHYRNEDTLCVNLIESALILKDIGFTAPYKVRKNDTQAEYLKRYRNAPVRENIYIEKYRRSFNSQSFYKEFLFNNNMIIETLRNNRVKYRNFELDPAINSYFFDGQIMADDKTIYIIKTAKNGGAKIYIDAESYAIVKLENYAPWTGRYLFQHKVKNYSKAIERERSMRITLEFQEYNNKMYLKYLDYSWSYEIYSEEKKKVVVVFDINNLLVINEVIEKPSKSDLANTKLMNKRRRLEDFSYEYDESFWTTYNLVKKNPFDSKSATDLEKNAPLDVQFKTTNDK